MVHMRWMIERDYPEVLACVPGWTEEDIRETLRARNCTPLVAEVPGSGGRYPLAGFLIYEMRRDSIDVLAFDVHPDFRGRGVGEAMMGTLKGKLSRHRRRQLSFWVPDNDLGAHLFLKAQGFRAEVILHDPYGDGGEPMRQPTCPDCGVPPGEFHLSGCDVERCPSCGGQRISCRCLDEPAREEDIQLPWTGEWPGVAECREYGWYCVLTADGWVPCRRDTPGATPDLNRLHVFATWDPRQGRFVRLPVIASPQ